MSDGAAISAFNAAVDEGRARQRSEDQLRHSISQLNMKVAELVSRVEAMERRSTGDARS